MKQFKAKTVAAILTASMALGMTGCTIEVDGDIKQVESLLASVAQNYQTSPADQNSPEKQDQTEQTYVLDEYGNIVKTASENAQEPVKVEESEAQAAAETAPEASLETAPEASLETAQEASVETAQEASVETVISSEKPKVEEAVVPSEERETEVSCSEPEETSVSVEESYTEEQTVPSEEKRYVSLYWAYREIVEQYEGNYRARFSFLHIDEDENPELVITDTSTLDDGYVLSIYTYKDGEVIAIYDNITVESYDTHTYTPYQNQTALLYEYEPCDYMVIKECAMEDMRSADFESLWQEPDENTPYYPIRGVVSYQDAMRYIRNDYFPTDDEFFSMYYGYYPSRLEIEDYSKYSGNYWENYETQNLSVYVHEDGQSVGISMWFYRTAELYSVTVPLYGNYAFFYYQGTDDRNYNGQIDPGEHFYRRATLEFQEYGVQVVIEELPDASYIRPELDVSEYFAGGVYIKENTYFFSLQHKS